MSELIVTADEFAAIRRLEAEFATIDPTPETGRRWDAAVRELLGPLDDGTYEIRVDWNRTKPMDRINRAAIASLDRARDEAGWTVSTS